MTLVWRGIPVSPGMAYGRALIYSPEEPSAAEAYFEKGEEAARLAAFEEAAEEAGRELDALLSSGRCSEESAQIIGAHGEILRDEEICGMIREGIEEERKMPAYAVWTVFEEFIGIIGGSADPLIAERAADLKDVRNRLLRILSGSRGADLSRLPGRVVIVAKDLLPSETANIDRKNVLAIVTEQGGATSHTAIIARNFGIPSVLGVNGAAEQIPDGREIAVDAIGGEVFVCETEAERAAFIKKKARCDEALEKTAAYIGREPLTADGERIEIGLNIGSDRDSDGYEHCDFIGLFRTEFLYMEKDRLPSEEELFSAYAAVLERAGGKPVTIRTLDIGGDKTLGYLNLPKEENPFLGKRALRLCFSEPELFMTQLRAILRASAKGRLQIMFPMVGSMEDFYRAKAALAEAMAELSKEGLPYDSGIRTGIMIEIPSMVMIADIAAREADFASIGTNDLCQYMTAADRMNPEVGEYCQSMSPAFLRALKRIADAFHDEGKPLSVCGEMGGDPAAVPLLIGLGIKKLSMGASKIAGVKEALSTLSAARAAETARAALSMKTQAEVLAALRDMA